MKRTSLTSRLTDRVRELILSGEYEPGEKLPTEQYLGNAMGVSRTVVREAISALKSEGLVTTRQGVGAFVSTDLDAKPFEIRPAEMESIEDAVQILELRMAVEIGMAGAAAQRHSRDNIDEMRKHLAAMTEATRRGEDATRHDFMLHREIAVASSNPYFLRFMDFLGARIVPRPEIATDDTSDASRQAYLDRIQSEHIALIDAIAESDEAKASAAMRAHLGNSLDRHREKLRGLGALA